MKRRFVVAVCGLAIEARIARASGVRSIVGGAATLADELAVEIRDGAVGLISFGIAGGLADDVQAGTCIVGRHVIDEGASVAAEPAWTAALAARVSNARIAAVAGSDFVVSDLSAKRALHLSTRAPIVDTESRVVARVAQANALPFAVFRVVCDAADRALPPAASVGVSSGGRIDQRAVLRSLVRSPAQIPALARTALDAAVALCALSRASRRLGPGLAYPDLRELTLDMA